MEKIILDLEFCKVSPKFAEQREICKEEIIQIGAVKLDEKDQIVDKFNEYVKPEFSRISKKVEKLTNISNEMLEGKRNFTEVIGDFIKWTGDKDTTVYSWSMEDKVVIERERKLKGVNDKRLENLLNNWVDLQQIIDNILCVSQNLSLDNVLKGINVQFVGQKHSAIDDAINTAFIYQTIQDRDLFEKKMRPLVEIMQPTESLTFSMGNLLQGILV